MSAHLERSSTVRYLVALVLALSLAGAGAPAALAGSLHNLAAPSAAPTTIPVINEFVANHTGTDTSEFIEIFGLPTSSYSSYTVLHLEGDSGAAGGPGVVDSAIAVGATDANGFWFTGYLSNALENGSLTLLLVDGFSGSVGADLDTNNDGVLDATPWSSLVDDVAVYDGGASDRVYSGAVLASGYDGVNQTPGGASRIPNGVDNNSTADWKRNDFDGAGLPGFAGTPAFGEALNTANALNQAVLADLSLDKQAPAQSNAGQPLVYTITLANPGNLPATNVIMTDTLPAGVAYGSDDSGVVPANPAANVYVWNLGTIGAGQTLVIHIDAQIDSNVPGGAVLVNTAQVATDAAGDDPSNNSDTASTSILLLLAIHDIQGAGHLSPYSGATVQVKPSIVTAVRSNSFYMQTPDADVDGDLATSEGLLVFTSSSPTVSVGDLVSVIGAVTEFYPGGFASNNLSTTEITGPSVTKISSGNPLPAATVVGVGGRIPPQQVIEDDATGDVNTSGVFDPDNDGIDFYESLEGMRLQVNDAVASGPTNNFGEISLLGDNGANASLRTPRGGIVLQPGDFNPERIIADDTIVANPPAMVTGDRFASPLVGVLDYSFGNFKLFTLGAWPAVVPGGLGEETAAAAAANQLSVATYNVENLDPNPGDGDDDAAKFTALGGHILHNLHAPDIIGLEEIQDNTGSANNGVVDAGQTYAALVAAIQAAGGPLYDYRDIAPLNNEDGGQPGANIRVGFLFRPDRVTFVDRPGGDATTATQVVAGANGPELTLSPGRIDPTNPAFNADSNLGYEGSRKSLAGEFLFKGQKVFVIVSHLKSKSQDTPLFGRVQPPNLITEVQRNAQAQVIHDFVGDILAAEPDANVVLLGDMNEFQFSPPMVTMKGNIITDLIELLPAGERYSYIYDGNSQALDHILLNTGLLSRAAVEVDAVHLNAEFTPASRATDHDPVLARIGFEADLWVLKTGPATALPGETLHYVIALANNSANTATDVILADPLPAPLSLEAMTVDGAPAAPVSSDVLWQGDLAPYQLLMVEVDASLPLSDAACGDLENTAEASSFLADPDPSDNSSTATTHVICADVAVAKSGPLTAVAGLPMAWDVTVSNLGPDLAVDVELHDQLPVGATFAGDSLGACQPLPGNMLRCWLGDLAAGQSVTWHIFVDLASTLLGPISNVASVARDASDLHTANNSAVATTEVTAIADLSLEKHDIGYDPPLDGEVRYNLNVCNAGPSAARSIVVTDQWPAGLVYMGSSGADCWPDPTVQGAQPGPLTIECSLFGALAPGQCFGVELWGELDAANPQDVCLNEASVSAVTFDPDLTNNAAAESTVCTDGTPTAVELTSLSSGSALLPSAGLPWQAVIAGAALALGLAARWRR